jgi:hypothetical protein
MRLLLVATCLALAIVSCGGDEDRTGDAPSVVTGTVVEVQSQSLTEVGSFVVGQDEKRYTIYIDQNTELDFPPAHLNEHRISGDPVRVEVEEIDDKLVATQIGDG